MGRLVVDTQADVLVESLAVHRGIQGIAGDAGRRGDAGIHGKRILVVIDRAEDSQIGTAGHTLGKTALPAVEIASGSIGSPETLHEGGVVERLRVHSRQRSFCLVGCSLGIAEVQARIHRPVLFLPERLRITEIHRRGQGGFPHVDRDGIQDAGSVVPLRRTD